VSILNKLWTGIRGHASEAGQAIVDANAITILEQEIRDSKTALNEAKSSLTTIMAQATGAERKVNKLKESIKIYTEHGKKAKAADNMDLVNDAVAKIQEIQMELGPQEKIAETYNANVANIKKRINVTERSIKALDTKLRMAKANEKVLKAQEITAANNSGSDNSATSALESLERLEKAQQEKADRFAAAEELAAESDPAAFEKKMADAGILDSSTDSSEDILKTFG